MSYVCARCEDEKPPAEYYRGTDGRRSSWCKACHRDINSRKPKFGVHPEFTRWIKWKPETCDSKTA